MYFRKPGGEVKNCHMEETHCSSRTVLPFFFKASCTYMPLRSGFFLDLPMIRKNPYLSLEPINRLSFQTSLPENPSEALQSMVMAAGETRL